MEVETTSSRRKTGNNRFKRMQALVKWLAVTDECVGVLLEKDNPNIRLLFEDNPNICRCKCGDDDCACCVECWDDYLCGREWRIK